MSANSKGFKAVRNNKTGRFVRVRDAKKNTKTTSVEIVPKKGHGDTGRYPKKK